MPALSSEIVWTVAACRVCACLIAAFVAGAGAEAVFICGLIRDRAPASYARCGSTWSITVCVAAAVRLVMNGEPRSEEHTSELQSLTNLVCRLLLEKKKKTHTANTG